jgi:hypothetical protein
MYLDNWKSERCEIVSDVHFALIKQHCYPNGLLTRRDNNHYMDAALQMSLVSLLKCHLTHPLVYNEDT